MGHGRVSHTGPIRVPGHMHNIASRTKGRSFGKHIETESISRRKSWAIRNIHIVIHRKCAEEDRESILHKVSEYLFDLFDANCMDEYHTLDRFESQAICITSR